MIMLADAQADLGLRCPHMPEDTFRMAHPQIVSLISSVQNSKWLSLSDIQHNFYKWNSDNFLIVPRNLVLNV